MGNNAAPPIVFVGSAGLNAVANALSISGGYGNLGGDQEGDLVLMVFAGVGYTDQNNPPNITGIVQTGGSSETPWTLLMTRTQDNLRVSIYYRFRTQIVSPPWTWRTDVNQESQLTHNHILYRNVRRHLGFDSRVNGTKAARVTSHIAPSLDAPTPSDWLLAFYGGGGNTPTPIFTGPVGMVDRLGGAVAFNTVLAIHHSYDRALGISGPTGDKTATTDLSIWSIGVSILLGHDRRSTGLRMRR